MKKLTYPFIKPITKEIWELRPLDNRILFAYYIGNQFVILSMFKKKTKKTPKSEIKRAQKYLKDFLKGSANYEEL